MFKPFTPEKLTRLTIAAAFLSFAAAGFLAPSFMEQLFAREPWAHLPAVSLAIGALSVHALSMGLFAAFGRFTSWTYPGFALSLLPIFAADYWLYATSQVFNELTFVHLGGMIVVLALCVRGFRQLQRVENAFAEA